MGEAAAIPAADLIPEAVEKQHPAFLHRRIEFHLARKPYNGLNASNGGDKGGEFRLETLNPSGAAVMPAAAARNLGAQRGKPDRADANGMDSELLSLRVNLRRIGAGLQNLGNTCFLNSVLQCLTYTEPFAAYLQSGKHENSCRMAGFCALCALQRHVSRALSSTGRIVAPKDLVSNLRSISRNFRNARQEDAHEYMVNLLESMHKCCLPSGVPSESPSAYERSLVHKIFGGRLCSQVKCMQCSFCSNKFDPFLDLSLEIMKADSLQKALSHFTAKEQLDGGERQYQCQQCKQKVKALKQLTIYKPPHVLAVHLKRFGSHISGQKIDKKIVFPPSLDLKPFVTGPYDGDLKYTLYGVLVHFGWSTHSGHYYCFVRTSSGMWYSLDDNQVIQVNERKVLEQKAYMLFYVRDQRNPIPKKPVDVSQKENAVINGMGNKATPTKKPVDVSQKENGVINAMGNKATPNFELGVKEPVQNGSLERKPDASLSHATPQGDIKDVSTSSGTQIKDHISVNNSGGMVNKLPSLQRDVGASTNVSPDEKSIVPLPNGGECLRQSSSAGKASERTLHPVEADAKVEISSKDDINGTSSRISENNVVAQSSTKKGGSDSCAAPTICNGDVDAKEAITGTVGNQLNVGIGASNEASSEEKTGYQKHDNEPSLATATISSLQQNNDKCSQDAIPSKLSGSGEVSPVFGQSPKLPTTLTVLSQEKALDKMRHLAVKKKVFKPCVVKMQLSTNIIFTTLSLRKRKKHKRNKLANSESKNPSKGEPVEGNCIGPDPGPSVSETKLVNSISACSQNKGRKRDKSGLKDVADSGGLQRRIDEEFRSRVGQSETALSTEKQPQTGPRIAAVDCLPQIIENSTIKDEKKGVNLMSILTRGLEETTVSRWDDIEAQAAEIAQPEGRESVTIGYVGDDWDEEYDRGKRKKVRGSKVEFGGRNPFQEIANKKTKRKRFNGGNEPFRI